MEKVTRRKVKPIARKRHNFVYLLLAILLGIATAYMFLTFPADYKFHLSNVAIPVLPIFLASFIAFIFTSLTFIFIQKTQGIIVSLLVFSYLILRLLGLTHWIFLLLFVALFITIELFIYKQK